MAKAVSLKILKLQYGGESIGNDILLEIEVAGEKSFSSYQTIKRGTEFNYNQEVKQFRGVENSFEIPLKIRVTEKDFLFSDVGETVGVISIDLNSLPKTFDFKVKVQERNKLTFGKSTAIFSITLEVREFNPIYPRPQVYINPPKKDYNRFDTEIANAVGEWNDFFMNQEYPPNTPLDPSLVKAMMYVESEIGYHRVKKGHHSSFPDIMQVGTPGDPALHTLNNDGWVNPDTGQVAKENEWKDKGVQVLDCSGEANAITYQESLKWGIRWLYHKAQYIENGQRKWFSWSMAVKRYGPGSRKDKDNPDIITPYQKNVLRIYREGISPEGKPLWLTALIFLGLIISTYFGLNLYNDSAWQNLQTASVIQATALDKLAREYDLKSSRTEYLENRLQKIQDINSDKLKNAIWQTFSKEDQEETEDVEVVSHDPSLFAAIVEYQKDWWENINIGRLENGKVNWLEIKNWPKGDYMENSILSARWVDLKGISLPVLEVFGITHMGNGDMYLFEVNHNQYSLLFRKNAVRGFWPTGETPEGNLKKYGYENCQETFKDGKLSAEYPDLNNDGVSDVVLTGFEEIVCDKITGENKKGTINTTSIMASEVPLKLEYFLNIK